MKKVSFILILFMLAILPSNAQFELAQKSDGQNSVVFVYHIPDEDENSVEANIKQEVNNTINITSDDVTADTSIYPEEYIAQGYEYDLKDMYSDVLKGYASYNEGEEDEISLDNISQDDILTINIQKPYHISDKDLALFANPALHQTDNRYSMFNTSEYSIEPISASNTQKFGGFSAGTTYGQEISYGELEQTSGIFSGYEYKRFAIRTSYMKTVNTTNNNYNDIIYISPQLKINQFLTIKNNFSSDLIMKRNKAEVIISVYPFGKKDTERLRIDFGANTTYYLITGDYKNQLFFGTNIKL